MDFILKTLFSGTVGRLVVICSLASAISLAWADHEGHEETEFEVIEEGSSESMTVDYLEQIIARFDENYSRNNGVIVFTYAERELTLVTDARADRMRIITPIIESEVLNERILHRVMQANFDSALDARYGIAQGVLWGTFMHRLSSLTADDFISGVGQTINISESFGTTFSSGELTFGGGDSGEQRQRQLIDDLLERGRSS